MTVKEAAHAIIDNLPDETSWDELLYEMYVRKKIEAGLKSSAEGCSMSHEEARKRLLGEAM